MNNGYVGYYNINDHNQNIKFYGNRDKWELFCVDKIE
jgi:hypothetical protein